MKQIKPSAGGYIKKDNLIYLAKPVGENDNCVGCAFHNFGDCSDIDCLYGNVIFEDVTDKITVELVEEQRGGFAPFIGLVLVILVAVGWMVYWELIENNIII